MTRLMFVRRGMGSVVPERRDGMPQGQAYLLERIRELAERKNQQDTKQ